MKNKSTPKNLKKAFSLLELSIVILIISILIVGSMSASITAINNAKYKVTRERMAEIYKAMGNYLLTNKALPCPASLKDLKASSSTYGVAAASTTCLLDGVFQDDTDSGSPSGLAYGMVPVQALGLNADMAEDGFGSKFTYVVGKKFTDPTVASASTGFGSVFPVTGITPPTVGFMTVKEDLGSSSFQVDTNDAVFVIISHGANKYGSFNNNSATQNTVATDADELTNHGTSFVDGSGTSDSVVVGSYFVSSAVNSDVFDDVVFYKTRNAILVDFNALSLAVCGSTGTNYGDYTLGSTTFAWATPAYYGQIVSATTTCASASSTYTTTVTSPTKRCGAFGIWQVGTINACTN